MNESATTTVEEGGAALALAAPGTSGSSDWPVVANPGVDVALSLLRGNITTAGLRSAAAD